MAKIDWEYFIQMMASESPGQVEDSIVDVEKLLSEGEDCLTKAAGLMTIAKGLRKLGRYPEAILKVDQICELLGPENEYYPRAAFARASIEMEQGNTQEALARLDEIMERFGRLLSTTEHLDLLQEIQQDRGSILTGLKRFRTAVPILESVREVETGKDAVLCDLGMCYFELAEFDSAKSAFEELLSLEPNSSFKAYAHYYIGMVMYRRGKLAWAKQEFEKSLACPDRFKLSEDNLLHWLVNTSKALNLDSEVARYSEMRKKIGVG
jgi:tetratricopeptide (TPR) repeat protein